MMVRHRCYDKQSLLYRFFLENQPLPCDENHLLLNNNFFLVLKVVKNGLYKASIKKIMKILFMMYLIILTILLRKK